MCSGISPRRRAPRTASSRPTQVIAAAPDIMIGSWCGKKFVPAKFAARPGFDAIPAVRDGFLREIKSPLILQPGPAALTDGLDAIEAIIAEWSANLTMTGPGAAAPAAGGPGGAS